MKPVSSTAFYCCGVRMEDTASRAPVCSDTYAKRFMDEAVLRIFKRFREFTALNTSNATATASFGNRPTWLGIAAGPFFLYVRVERVRGSRVEVSVGDRPRPMTAIEHNAPWPQLAVSRGSRCAPKAAAGQIELALGMAAYKRSRELALSARSRHRRSNKQPFRSGQFGVTGGRS